MTPRHPVALALLLFSVMAGAQCAAGRIAGRTVDEAMLPSQALGQVRGRVFDEYGGSIPDASVMFQPLDPRSGLTEFAGVADSRGRFDFEAVRPGTYRVTCRALGYETSVLVQDVRPGVQTEVTLTMRAVK
jgi:protocatechuate 3,4-dioxygenase beta subunit